MLMLCCGFMEWYNTNLFKEVDFMEKEQMRLEIKEDKIIDILMHAATRDDISKLDSRIDRIESRIDALDKKIDNVRTELKCDINNLSNKVDKIMWLIVGSILMPVFIYMIQNISK